LAAETMHTSVLQI